MKPKLKSGYLYEDGTAVLVYEKRDKHLGTVEYCEIVEKYARTRFEGRIVFYRAALLRLIKGHEVHIGEGGSDLTKARGIHVVSMSIHFPDDYMYIPTFPDLISCEFTHQGEIVETFDDLFEGGRWAHLPIAKIHRKELKAA